MSEASVLSRPVAAEALAQRVRAALGYAGVLGIGALSLLLCVTAAAGASFDVPAGRHDFTTWIAGPLHGLVSRTLTAEQSVLVLVAMCVCYAATLAWGSSVRARWVVTAIVLLHLLYAIAPPLISKDVFSYISYARLGATHGSNPYQHAPFLFPNDAAYPFVAWRHVGSAYGPLFTVATYPLAFVSVPVAMWTIKIVTAIASLGLVALTWRCAERMGRDPVKAAIWVGLNPILLVYGVGGAHNDLIMLALMMGAVALTLEKRESLAAGAVILSVAIKATGAPMLPFLFLQSRDKRRVVLGALAAAIPLLVITYAAFGTGALGLLKILKRQQLLVSGDAMSNQLAKFVGLSGVTSDVRLISRLLLAGSLAWLAWAVWRRGMDWVAATGWSMVAL
ncbi:MAG: alpha,6-mannosyltransferase, partial [Thermoleophilales bacterium]|nr:alpha,6-mannosyltransferase [Thermoleophilales bacterium]